jgi:hypothetical protein
MESKDKLYCSAVGTLAAEIITLPVCTVKTIYQNNPSHEITDSIQYIYKQNKMMGFFSASKPAIIAQVLSTSSKYTLYEEIKKYRNTNKNDILNNSLNGMTSGILGSLLTHPIDCWKNFNQRNESYSKHLKSLYKSPFLFITDGMYKGYTGSIGKNIALYSCLFPLNDFYKSKFDSTLISAPLTTITVSLIVQPFDYYKVVKMGNNKPDKPFRGLSLMIARSLPHFVITLYVTEWLLNKKI